MDVAYDHIQEEAYPPEGDELAEETGPNRPRAGSNDLGVEFKEAYQVISATPWAARLGGFFGQVKKQSESYYEGARQELSIASSEATKGWTGLLAKTQGLSISQNGSDSSARADVSTNGQSKDIVKEAEAILSRFRADAAGRLRQIQRAEDAADEALERFGANLKNFLRDAVTIAPPPAGGIGKDDVLFESKDADGKRVVHATRFDAQLHVIHSNLSSFRQDPDSSQFSQWTTTFDIDSRTDAIAKDLDRYGELRRAMDKLVPETVSYTDFWTRYYFLRYVIETEEQRRRELLKDSQAAEEEVAWDDDEEEDDPTLAGRSQHAGAVGKEEQADAGATTPTNQNSPSNPTLLKPIAESRRSNEHSVADSDASYDIVSRGPGTPKEERELGDKRATSARIAQSDAEEEDWE